MFGIRTALVTLSVIVGLTSTSALAQQGAPVFPNDSERIQALLEFQEGNFMPYGEYLQKSLDWYLYQLQQSSSKLDPVKIRNSIIRAANTQKAQLTDDALKQKLRLTEFTLKKKIEYATTLFENNNRGKTKEYKQKVHDLYLDMALYFEILSKADQAAEYRRKAAEYN